MSTASETVKRAFQVLGSFVKSVKLAFHDVEFSVELGTQPGIADSGDLEHDLIELFVEIGKAVKAKGTALALFIDEIQHIKEEQFAALIMALHRCAQDKLPIILIGAGLPQLVGQAGRAKSYAERLFEYPEIGPLNEAAARQALVAPAEKLNVTYTDDALAEILLRTQGYPYFLQEWGKHSWQCATTSPITHEDVQYATALAIHELDVSFFRVRVDRLTPAEKKYLRAMAELDVGQPRSGDIARLLRKKVNAVGPTRATLIAKGMIYSPGHGDNAFTVPLFGEYMKRIMPDYTTIFSE